MKTELHQAIDTLIKALNEDDQYRYSWQANIAMAIKDELYRAGITGELIHKACNQGAINFLGQFTSSEEDYWEDVKNMGTSIFNPNKAKW